MRDDEREHLGPWCEASGRSFGTEPVVVPLETTGASAGPLFQIRYPAIEPAEAVGQSGHFAQSPALVEHVRGLGYEWNEAGRIIAAPTPSTFNALLGRGESRAGYGLAYLVEDAMNVSLGPWLASYLRGRVPVHVCTRAFYEAVDPRAAGMLRWQLTTLVHDLTVHALNYHLVPREGIAALGDQIRRDLPERASIWAVAGSAAPLTLTHFYDNDLNRFAYAVWSACDVPADFARLFEAHFVQLTGALALRIDETRRGLGDVPGGNSRDMAPLAPVEFRVERAQV